MASLDDILTVAKNIVTAVNGAAQNYLNVQGAQNAVSISATSLIKNSAGRLAQVSITVAGSAVGTIYDSTSTTSPTNPIYTIPNTIGVFFVNLPVSYGIVVKPGTGQTLTISYS